MFKNYLKIAWRSLLKNKTSSIINISGLAVGLAIGVLVLLFVLDEFSYNTFHTNLSDIHLLMKRQKVGNETHIGKSVAGPLASALRTGIPEIKYASRQSYQSQQLINTGDKSLYEKGIYVDPDYFRMMTYPAIAGDPVLAMQAGSVVITEQLALKLFGNTDVVGKNITQNNTNFLQIGAVIRDVPENSSEKFNLVMPFTLLEKENKDLADNWHNNSILTWVQLQSNVNVAVLNAKLDKLIQEREGSGDVGLIAYPFKDLWLKGQFNRDGKPGAGRLEAILVITVIGLFVLLIACINFMNLATARSERRSREVGVRKVMGAFRRQVIFQFLCESMLVAVFAMIVGIVLAIAALPVLNYFIEKTINFGYADWRIWVSLLGLVLFTGLVAGSYPAFYLSSFKPVRILRGAIFKPKSGGSWLRKGLVTFQFVVSIFLIIATIVVYRQLQHAQNRPVGYDLDNLVDIPARGDMGDKFQLVKNELTQLPGIVSISAGNSDLIRFNAATNGITWPGKREDQNFYINLADVAYDWIKTSGLQLAEGRDFSPDFGTDSNACLLNESAVQKMELKAPVIGTRLGGHTTVIGIVKDFVYNSPYEAPRPLYIQLKKSGFNHFLIRIRNDDNWRKTMAGIEKVMKKTNPNYPFEYRFTSEEYQKRFTGLQYMSQLAMGLGILTIFISCLGLFALSGFLAERRTKEIGVRKVLGATVPQVWAMLSKDFLKPVIIAFIVATPLTGWVMQQMLINWEYHTSLTWWMFAVAGVATALIAVLTISFHGIQAAFANPAKSLRTE
jgi:ABC-type antimicrobial peptide transport system permease subunit